MQKLIKIVRNTKNKGKTHIFLGNPMSDGCDKTVVEPGNSYSPGIWTFGISIWIETENGLFTPDLLDDDEITWKFEDEGGCPPVILSQYRAGGSIIIKNTLTHLGTEGSEGMDFCEVEAVSQIETSAILYIVVRDIGPAGGKIESIQWDAVDGVLVVDGSAMLYVEQLPDCCKIESTNESFDSPMAVLQYNIEISQNNPFYLKFKTEHGFNNRLFSESIPKYRPYAALTVEEGFRKSREEWHNALPARVFSPDLRIAQAWETCSFHILSAMENGIPRIGAVNYPVFWLRDGVIILRALDLMGRHDMARIGNEYIASVVFNGGFGAEADAPGEGIWALISHALITGDRQWLENVFIHIEKRVEWIEKMLNADSPVRMLTENRIPFYQNVPGVNIVCLPAINGTIHGRMDWHSPDFFINCWAEGGLRLASKAANLLGKGDLAEKWNIKAEKLFVAIREVLMPDFGNDERNSIIAPYPSNALVGAEEELKERFREWYLKNRLTPYGKRNPEPLWTYFEAAQIHNAILLGLKEEAWVNLDGMLDDGGKWNVFSYVEGQPLGNEYLPFMNGEARRGWLRENAFGGNMPHNWTSAEMVNLIRTIFVVEEKDMLVLGKGVPAKWLKPGLSFGIKDMPTSLGIVSYTVSINSAGKLEIDYKGPEKYRLCFEL